MSGLLKSCLSLQPLLALLLLSPHLRGSFQSALQEETVLSDITCNFLVQEAAACSLNTPAALPVMSFCSPHPLPLEHASHHPAFKSDPYLQAYLTCHFFRKPLLALPVRCNLFFLIIHSRVFLRTLSNSAFLLQLGLYFLISIILRLLFTSWQCWEHCLALINICLTSN